MQPHHVLFVLSYPLPGSQELIFTAEVAMPRHVALNVNHPLFTTPRSGSPSTHRSYGMLPYLSAFLPSLPWEQLVKGASLLFFVPPFLFFHQGKQHGPFRKISVQLEETAGRACVRCDNFDYTPPEKSRL